MHACRLIKTMLVMHTCMQMKTMIMVGDPGFACMSPGMLHACIVSIPSLMIFVEVMMKVMRDLHACRLAYDMHALLRYASVVIDDENDDGSYDDDDGDMTIMAPQIIKVMFARPRLMFEKAETTRHLCW